jgi:hypothetical protein
MSDAVTTDESVETDVPEDKTDVTPEGMDTAEYVTFERLTGQVDVPKYVAAYNVIAGALPGLDESERDSAAFMETIANALIACRNACLYKEKPDTFGNSDAYRKLHKRMAYRLHLETGLSQEWIAKKLTQAKTNYLNGKSSGAKDMLVESIVRDAVKTGAIKNAQIKADGTVVIAEMVRRKQEDGKMKLVPDLDKNGQPRTQVYSPGTTSVPEAIKDAVKAVYQERAGTQTKGDKIVPRVEVPTRFGGPQPEEKGKGGRKPDSPEAWNEHYQEGLQMVTESVGRLNSLLALQWLHREVNAICNGLNALKGVQDADAHKAICDDIGHLIITQGAVLTQNATPDDLAPYRPEDAPSEADAVPKDAEAATEDDKAADDAASTENEDAPAEADAA